MGNSCSLLLLPYLLPPSGLRSGFLGSLGYDASWFPTYHPHHQPAIQQRSLLPTHHPSVAD